MMVNRKFSAQIICSIFSFLLLFSSCAKTGTKTRSDVTAAVAGQTELSPYSESTETAEDADPQTDNKSVTVYITRTGTKYHRDGCQYLSNSKIPVDLNKLDSEKYAPCSVCKPPARN